ncbi:NTP transferase domain-containing protein [Granulicella sp. L60]|uniref:nucleotidyltransferase family protein n=1 Tax=Granulicella sp. L60 TaxID=1641866 RepID=UPI00131E05D3|nr:nucleotidyltransferase family protein [Granulicella sp. L60]
MILAAGASTRLGHPKQLIRLGNETLLDRSVRNAREAGCAPVVVVLGAFEDQIRDQCKLHDVLIVSHPEWTEGMGTTLSRGVQAFEDVQGILVMTCDMPAVTADHLRSLATLGRVAATSYGGRKGVPAYFSKDRFPELLELKGDMGARRLLQRAHSIELPGGELDVDTFEDLAKARSIFG